MPLYNACSYLLGPGSVIRKGNWGRGLKLRGTNHRCWNRERIYEEIRKKYYPHRPSRLNCNFLCSTIRELQDFVDQNDRWFDVFYEVRLVNPNASLFTTNLSFLTKPDEDNEMHEIGAYRYWKPDYLDDGIREILVNCDIVIIKQVERLDDTKIYTSSASLPF